MEENRNTSQNHEEINESKEVIENDNEINTQKNSNDNQDEELELSMEELLKAEENIAEKLYNGELVYVRVVDVRSDYVYVDIGEKNEALIPVSDFTDFRLPNPGTKIIAVLEKKGNIERPTILSYRKAKEKITLKMIEEKFNKKERIKGKISEQVKGGYIVNINGIRAFMPLSLSELGGSSRHYLPVNAKVKFYVITLEPHNKKIIISRRAVLEEDEKIRREKIISELSEGINVKAVVSKVIDTGLFIRFKGIEGFVKLEDIDWKKPKEELSKYKRGQRIKVKILSIDKESQKITFGIKQTKPNPIDVLKKKFPFRTIVKGKIVELRETYVKAHITDDIYGIINEEDYGYDGIPEKDTIIDAVVIGVNNDTYELKLSIKKYEQIENRKTIEHYSKHVPKITLGQLLKDTTKDT
ncbi:MAG: S1 RNA-binding domain-containing protein [Elusimicrobiales bacterium]|nr:S1 RNA-binding domain-containing protein [Elusimicrobiales bacterium]